MKRTIRNPWARRKYRVPCRMQAHVGECVAPSISTTRRASRQAKSAKSGPIGFHTRTCVRQRAIRNPAHIFRSAEVAARLSARVRFTSGKRMPCIFIPRLEPSDRPLTLPPRQRRGEGASASCETDEIVHAALTAAKSPARSSRHSPSIRSVGRSIPRWRPCRWRAMAERRGSQRAPAPPAP